MKSILFQRLCFGMGRAVSPVHLWDVQQNSSVDIFIYKSMKKENHELIGFLRTCSHLWCRSTDLWHPGQFHHLPPPSTTFHNPTNGVLSVRTQVFYGVHGACWCVWATKHKRTACTAQLNSTQLRTESVHDSCSQNQQHVLPVGSLLTLLETPS